MVTIKANGARIRSRTEQIEIDVKSTKYFIGKERNFYDKKLITRFELSNGEIVEEKLNYTFRTQTFENQYKSLQLYIRK